MIITIVLPLVVDEKADRQSDSFGCSPSAGQPANQSPSQSDSQSAGRDEKETAEDGGALCSPVSTLAQSAALQWRSSEDPQRPRQCTAPLAYLVLALACASVRRLRWGGEGGRLAKWFLAYNLMWWTVWKIFLIIYIGDGIWKQHSSSWPFLSTGFCHSLVTLLLTKWSVFIALLNWTDVTKAFYDSSIMCSSGVWTECSSFSFHLCVSWWACTVLWKGGNLTCMPVHWTSPSLM